MCHTPLAFSVRMRFADLHHRVSGGVTIASESSETAAPNCPNCGGPVVYRGVGRRPVWCSTKCRNDAAAKRRGARLGAVEVRLVHVPREAAKPAKRRPAKKAAVSARSVAADPALVSAVLNLLHQKFDSFALWDPKWAGVREQLVALGAAITDPNSPMEPPAADEDQEPPW